MTFSPGWSLNDNSYILLWLLTKVFCNLHFHFCSQCSHFKLIHFHFCSQWLIFTFIPLFGTLSLSFRLHHFHFQFPSMMEFLPSFLIHVWDSALTPVFHTFLFDCDHDRALALQVRRRDGNVRERLVWSPWTCSLQAPDSPPARYSAWAWETQFTPEQVISMSISSLNIESKCCLST